MRLSPGVRSAIGTVCWIVAVVIALLTASAFAGAGLPCQEGHARSCPPQTLVLIGGIVLTLCFGGLGARLRKRRGKRETRFPWEYHDR
jgi:hypothetical protein